ncbi:MAG TPA: FHA domain-containing protein [Opitutales bacterium]|nr:FHA domain-containing protein [Opitutales bacterium]
MSNAFGTLFRKLFGGRSGGASDGVASSAIDGSHDPFPDKAKSPDPEVWLYPDSEELHKQTLLKARRIEQPVFRIGRRISDAVHYPDDNPPDMLIVENAPFTLSRMQCQIEIKGHKVIVRDLGSRVGTMLGRKRLQSSSRKPSSAVVSKGEHSLVLGYPDGPFRFRLVVR